MRFQLSPKIVALCAVVLLTFAGCKSDEDKLNGFLERGLAAVEEERWEEAVIELRNVIQIDPNHAQAHFELAKAYGSLEKLREAYWELHEAARLDPSNIEARHSYTQLALIGRDYDEVLEQTDGLIASDPSDALAHTWRANALLAVGRSSEAEESFKKAIEVKPEESQFLLNLIQFYARDGRDKDAEPWVTRFVAEYPGFQSYTTLARQELRLRRDGAEGAFKKALSVAEGDERSSAYRNLSTYYYGSGEVEAAVRTLERGMDELPEDLDMIYALASIEAARGNNDRSNKLVERAASRSDDDARPHLVLSAHRGRQGDLEGALAAAEAAIAAAPDDIAGRVRKAEVLVDLGYRNQDDSRIEESRSIVDAILEEQPTSHEALFVRGKIEMAQLNPQAAVESLQAALDVNSDWAPAHYVLGSALMLLGDQHGARASLGRAVELDPTQLDARRALARVHSALGEHEYAIDQAKSYLEQRPDDTPTRITMAQSYINLGKPERAMRELRAIPEDQRGPEGWFAIARLDMVNGKLEAARTSFLRALEDRPTHPDILRSLHVIDANTNRLAESAKRIESATKAEPDNARLAQLQGLVLARMNDAEGAEAAFKRATELDPTDALAFQQLAQFYRLTGRLDDAISAMEASLKGRPEDGRMHERLALLYESKGDRPNAMIHYEAAIERDLKLGHSRNNLAYLLVETQGDLDRALDLAQEAKALLPDSPQAADTLGWVLYKRGIPSAAIGYLREAANGLQPGTAERPIVLHHLASAYEANEEKPKALKTAKDALKEAKGLLKGAEAPPWVADIEKMVQRLGA